MKLTEDQVLALTDSPIEDKLFRAMMDLGWDNGWRLMFGRHGGERWSTGRARGPRLEIVTQCPVLTARGTFRVDLRLRTTSDLVYVECDGHDFHERTREQAARDKARDRELVRTGLVLRFTGSEIARSPENCAEDVLGRLHPASAACQCCGEPFAPTAGKTCSLTCDRYVAAIGAAP